MVVTFLAIMELIKERLIDVVQNETLIDSRKVKAVDSQLLRQLSKVQSSSQKSHWI